MEAQYPLAEVAPATRRQLTWSIFKRHLICTLLRPLELISTILLVLTPVFISLANTGDTGALIFQPTNAKFPPWAIILYILIILMPGGLLPMLLVIDLHKSLSNAGYTADRFWLSTGTLFLYYFFGFGLAYMSGLVFDLLAARRLFGPLAVWSAALSLVPVAIWLGAYHLTDDATEKVQSDNSVERVNASGASLAEQNKT